MNKTIHYCWFGRNKKSELIVRCMDTWRKYCPEWRIVEWNEDNFDVSINNYVRNAYERKMWAFVSDYCRFYALYHHGGIYLDTDVELIASLDNLPVSFVGFENADYVNSGLIRGAEKGDNICKSMLESYDADDFVLDNGDMNLRSVCERETSLLKQIGLVCNDQYQELPGITVFPHQKFCPLNYATGELEISPEAVSIHHFAASWTPVSQKIKAQVFRRLSRIIGESRAARLRKGLRDAAKTYFKT